MAEARAEARRRTGRSKCALYLALLFGFAPSPSGANDFAKIRSQAPDDEFRSAVGMYDIERCFIDVDALATPIVYRQPDRPDVEMIAWESAILIELRRIEGGTLVRTHFESPGGRKARKRLLACAGKAAD